MYFADVACCAILSLEKIGSRQPQEVRDVCNRLSGDVPFARHARPLEKCIYKSGI
jgi:hypothetical protein